jgi:hypothetical protein
LAFLEVYFALSFIEEVSCFISIQFILIELLIIEYRKDLEIVAFNICYSPWEVVEHQNYFKEPSSIIITVKALIITTNINIIKLQEIEINY